LSSCAQLRPYPKDDPEKPNKRNTAARSELAERAQWNPYSTNDLANNVRDSETRNEKRAALYEVLTKDLGKKCSAELQWGK